MREDIIAYLPALGFACKAGFAKVVANINLSIPEKKNNPHFIYLRVDRKLVQILLADIRYIESARDYVKVVTKDKNYITRQTISSIEAMLSGNEFVRIHRS